MTDDAITRLNQIEAEMMAEYQRGIRNINVSVEPLQQENERLRSVLDMAANEIENVLIDFSPGLPGDVVSRLQRVIEDARSAQKGQA